MSPKSRKNILALLTLTLSLTAALSSRHSQADDVNSGNICVAMIASERDPRVSSSSSFASSYSCDGGTSTPLTPVGVSFPQEVSGQLSKFFKVGLKLIGCDIHRASEVPTIRTQYICTFSRS